VKHLSAVDLTATVAASGVISPAAIATNQNDWSPAGLATASSVRVDQTTPCRITGFAGGAEGRFLIVQNVSAFPLMLASEDGGSAASNRLALGVSWLVIAPQDVCLLRYDGTASRWRCSGPDDPTLVHHTMRRIRISEDFLATGSQGAIFSAATTGTGASLSTNTVADVNATSKAFHCAQLTTGTTATGRCGMAMSSADIVPGLGTLLNFWRAKVSALSTVTDEYKLFMGVQDGAQAAGDVTDGVWVEYDRATGGNFWRTGTAQGGTRTKNTSSVPVSASDYIWLGFIINAAWTSVEFLASTDLLTWSSLGTHTTNIPGSSQLIGLGAKIEKSAGTTSRNALIDCVELIYEYRRGM
jgi:hypothetical protein